MPLYEYKCEGCGKEFETIQRITADPLDECQDCAGKLVKKFSPTAPPIFKGKGFHATDYNTREGRGKKQS